MATNAALAGRIQSRLQNTAGLADKKMFGGIGFMIYGNMAVGVYNDYMIVRAGADQYETLLAEPYAREFDITGRGMTGWVMVSADGLHSDKALDFWIKKGVDFALALPPK